MSRVLDREDQRAAVTARRTGIGVALALGVTLGGFALIERSETEAAPWSSADAAPNSETAADGPDETASEYPLLLSETGDYTDPATGVVYSCDDDTAQSLWIVSEGDTFPLCGTLDEMLALRGES